MKKKRGARPARFATLRAFYANFKADLMTSESAKANIESTGYVIYESELEKFASEYPDIDIADFTEFIKAHGAHKVAGKKVTGTGGKQYQLNTKEKAEQIGRNGYELGLKYFNYKSYTSTLLGLILKRDRP